MSDEQRYLDMKEQEQRILERLDEACARQDDWKLEDPATRTVYSPTADGRGKPSGPDTPVAPIPDFEQWLTSLPMPDHEGLEDDDETIGPWYNDTGDFGDSQQGDDDDNE